MPAPTQSGVPARLVVGGDARSRSSAADGPADGPAGTTRVVARFDVGFGNELFIRGEGAGLSWDRGTHMKCIGGNEWTFATTEAESDLVVKFLINDERWCTGDDFVVLRGRSTILAPEF